MQGLLICTPQARTVDATPKMFSNQVKTQDVRKSSQGACEPQTRYN